MLWIIAAIVINDLYYDNICTEFDFPQYISSVVGRIRDVVERIGITPIRFCAPLLPSSGRPDNNNITILYSFFILFNLHSADRSNPFDRRRKAALVLRPSFSRSERVCGYNAYI